MTFNKQVIGATGLVARGVYLKVQDRQWPCVVFSSSMTAAKVIAGVKTAFFNSLRQGGSKLSLRWCFKVPQETEPITFYRLLPSRRVSPRTIPRIPMCSSSPWSSRRGPPTT